MNKLQCEGWRRTGGAFTFGPVQWDQCKNTPVAIIVIKQGGKQEKPMPACLTCWEECENTKGITVISAKPIKSD